MKRINDLQAWSLRRLGRTLLETHDEIDDGHAARGYTERHSDKLAVQTGDDLADGLGRIRGRRNNVGSGTRPTTLVL